MSRSLYGDRDTVGTMAVEAMMSTDIPVAGDLGHELMPSLVDDLNNTIASNPYDGRPFYITIHEKKDAQLTNTLLRRMITSERRPYPEPNTEVFWTDPKSNETLFCWSLPHQSVFNNYIFNPDYYVAEQIEDIKAYLAEDLPYFGFRQVGTNLDKTPIIIAIPGFKDRKMGKEKTVIKFKL